MVASLQEVIGREARAQLLRRRSGACPTRSSPASAAAATRSASCGRSSIRRRGSIGVEAGGRGDALGDNAASLGLGAPGVLHGAFTMLTQDAAGQVVEPHSVIGRPRLSRASGRSSPRLRSRAGSRCVRATDAEALEATQWLARTCGIIPALESAHAMAAVLAMLPELPPDAHVLVNLSGRGDKDLGILERELAAP